MKKIVALFMAMVLALSLLCACGEDEKKNTSPSNLGNKPDVTDDAVINW